MRGLTQLVAALVVFASPQFARSVCVSPTDCLCSSATAFVEGDVSVADVGAEVTARRVVGSGASFAEGGVLAVEARGLVNGDRVLVHLAEGEVVLVSRIEEGGLLVCGDQPEVRLTVDELIGAVLVDGNCREVLVSKGLVVPPCSDTGCSSIPPSALVVPFMGAFFGMRCRRRMFTSNTVR